MADAQHVAHDVALAARGDGGFAVTVDGRAHRVDATRDGAVWSLRIDGRTARVTVARRGDAWIVASAGRTRRVTLREVGPSGAPTRAAAASRELRAVMPGKVLAVLVATGEPVVAGQGIVVIEAMKMENEIVAPRSGVVRKLTVKPEQAVESGELLAVIE